VPAGRGPTATTDEGGGLTLTLISPDGALGDVADALDEPTT
jgi:hypothetical protein